MENVSALHLTIPHDLKIPYRQITSSAVWSLATPEQAETHENFVTYTDLETYKPDPFPSYNLYANEAISGHSPLQVPMMSEEKAEESPLYDPISCKVEYSSGCDEGIGSNSSSSNPSPVFTFPEHQNYEQMYQSASYIPQMHTGSPTGPGIGYAEHHSNFNHTLELPKTECLSCGSSFSNFWCQNGIGHYLCEHCFLKKDTVPMISTPERSVDLTCTKRRNKAISKIANRTCINCQTDNTPLWRRDETQQFLCNACALYKRLHKRSRPISMNKGTIQRRNRKPRSDIPKTKEKVVTKGNALTQSTMEPIHISPVLRMSSSAHVSAIGHVSAVSTSPSEPLYVYSISQADPQANQENKVILPSISSSIANAFFSLSSEKIHHYSDYQNDLTTSNGN